LLAGLERLSLSFVVKRLVWIFLAMFCTALAQVQPVELLKAKQDSCGCCEKPGACGMPDCSVPVASAQPILASAVAATAIRAAVKQEAKTADKSVDKFYTAFVDAGVRPAIVRAPVGVARVASVPLFKEHCAFLI
jgi:hypothetical protein